MVCLRFTSLALWLLLSLASLRDSIAVNHQEIDALASSHHAIELNKKELQVEAEAEAVTRRKMLRGRKMGVKDEMKKEKITGAINPSVGKCEDINGGKGEYSKLECELKVNRGPPSSVKHVGLIPFSSDYHAPRTHPPKNN